MSEELITLVWQELRGQLNTLNQQVESVQRVERALIADSIPAYTLANAPSNLTGGLGNMTTYVTLAWISDGRKSGEGAGTGTGVLAVFQSSSNQWLRLTDYAVVVV